jgi:hypothetical protein
MSDRHTCFRVWLFRGIRGISINHEDFRKINLTETVYEKITEQKNVKVGTLIPYGNVYTFFNIYINTCRLIPREPFTAFVYLYWRGIYRNYKVILVWHLVWWPNALVHVEYAHSDATISLQTYRGFSRSTPAVNGSFVWNSLSENRKTFFFFQYLKTIDFGIFDRWHPIKIALNKQTTRLLAR